jgi:hypothetical protein
MRNDFTLEQHALERHPASLREPARERRVDQSASPVARTMLMTTCAALAGLPVLTLVFASSAATFGAHIPTALIVA